LPHLEASILRGSNAARGHSAMRLVRLLGLWPAERGAAGVQAAAAVLRGCQRPCEASDVMRRNKVPCVVRISPRGL